MITSIAKKVDEEVREVPVRYKKLGSNFHSSLKTSPLFSETLQNSFTSLAFNMNYCAVLAELRSQVKDSYEVL